MMAHADTTQAQGVGAEGYTVGYRPWLLQLLSQRSIATDGAFFVPHVRPGMRLLDCGCGPGVMTVEWAKRVAPGEVVGLDLEVRQCAAGQARARADGVANVWFVGGTLYALPFPDQTFDAVIAHAVVYHLREPQAALAEMYRVLAPGGAMGLRDADHGGNVYAPTQPTLAQAWALIDRVLEYHGAHLWLGRNQRALLRAVGCQRVIASASYDHYGTPELLQSFSAYWVEFLGSLHAELILAQGWVDRPTLNALCAALTAWGAHPDAFYARARCEVVGWKA